MHERILLAFVDMTKDFQKSYFIRQCLIVVVTAITYILAKAAHQGLEGDSLAIVLCTGYLTDFATPFALFGISNAVFSLRRFRIVRFWPTMVLCGIAAFAWEFLAPAIVPWSTTDPFDLIAYMAGASSTGSFRQDPH